MHDASHLAKAVRLAVFDVDGVFSDGHIYYNSQGVETKAFHVHDGLGVQLLKRVGIVTAVITARQSALVTKRMDELGIDHVFQGSQQKQATLALLLKDLALSPTQVCYMGDDLPDLAVMQWVGLAIAPANAHTSVRAVAHYTTTASGGEGAVREACDFILTAQGHLTSLIQHFGAVHV
jgi:3-deoxy-D-manno-octulosonate 8-phosphate phosphatase (KDO 8-P phosphatase)